MFSLAAKQLQEVANILPQNKVNLDDDDEDEDDDNNNDSEIC